MTQFFDWFQLCVTVCLLCLLFGRALHLYSRGIRVVVIDRESSTSQAMVDLVVAAGFVLWIYETLAYVLPLHVHVIPHSSRFSIVESTVLKCFGMTLSLLGLLIYGLALQALGKYWRIGIDKATPGRLVTHGIFALTRNPIYVGLDLLALGTFLVIGQLVFLIFALVIVGGFHYQILREENFLIRTYEEAYRDYCSRVGRYVKVPPIIISALPRR
ncbi:MAG: methyltransferase family protein [Desulfomonilaceae bacterium]